MSAAACSTRGWSPSFRIGWNCNPNSCPGDWCFIEAANIPDMMFDMSADATGWLILVVAFVVLAMVICARVFWR
jgi:hypothetical protein